MWTFPILPSLKKGEGEECNYFAIAIIEVFKNTFTLCVITSNMLYIPFLVCFHFLGCLSGYLDTLPTNLLCCQVYENTFYKVDGDIRRYSHWIFSTLAVLTWQFYCKFHCLEMNICLCSELLALTLTSHASPVSGQLMCLIEIFFNQR